MSLGRSLFAPRFQGLSELVRGFQQIFFPLTAILSFSSVPLSLCTLECLLQGCRPDL